MSKDAAVTRPSLEQTNLSDSHKDPNVELTLLDPFPPNTTLYLNLCWQAKNLFTNKGGICSPWEGELNHLESGDRLAQAKFSNS